MPSRPSRFLTSALLALLAAQSSALAQWSPVRFTNPELRAKGTLTGDGCQWVRALTIAPSDGDFMMWCTDVGGIFRSLDGGANWEPANVGFNSRGSAGVAIDPHNASRVLVVAANSIPTEFNGIYLSTDQAASWKQVFPVKMASSADHRNQIAFDPSSFDAELGHTRVAYWSRIDEDKANGGWAPTIHEPGFYKSEDGGLTWKLLPDALVAADAHIAVHPTKGHVYAGTKRGLQISRDGGATWSLALPDRITSVAVSPAAPESVWVTLTDRILRSDDAGATFTPLAGSSALAAPESTFRQITVAPSDASRLTFWRLSPNWVWPRFVSADGGATWRRSELLKDRVIVPSNARESHFAFHPQNPDIILSTGGDYPTLSRDGGHTYALAGNGVNNILIGGVFNFSTTNPDVIYLGSQDYATLLSTDGGENWTYTEPGKKGWGGFNYAAYASSADTLLVGEAENWGSPKLRALSRDRGQTWDISSEAISPLFTYGDPRDSRVLFAGDQRSDDDGQTWTALDGVDSVRTHAPGSGHLYGLKSADAHSSRVMKSEDHGVTWSPVCEVPGKPADLAVDERNQRLFVVTEQRLWRWRQGDESPEPITTLVHDQAGYPRVMSVALDPVDPNIIYIAGNRDVFASNASAQRSLDGGLTWTNLTRQTPLDGQGLDGGREAICVRVHPRTRDAWFTTGCYGVWKHQAPDTAP